MADEPEVVDIDETANVVDTVDDAPEVHDEAETKALRAVARQMGWKPEADWKGDKSGWVDAADYIAKTTRENRSLKEQVQRTTRTAEKIIERERKASEKEIERRIRELTEANDADGVIEATRELAEVRNTDKSGVQQFVAENPWFETDLMARNIAIAASELAARQGKSEAEQFEAAKAKVREMMPDLFDDAPTKTSVRTSPKAPMVQAGSRGHAPSKARGWSDIPQAARNAAAEMVRKGMCSEKEYAEEYWKENA